MIFLFFLIFLRFLPYFDNVIHTISHLIFFKARLKMIFNLLQYQWNAVWT